MILYSLPFLRMMSVKPAVAAGVLAVVLSACSSAVKPPHGRGAVDDPRTKNPNRITCLRSLGLPVTVVGQTGIQIGSLPAGPTIQFTPTPGVAQGLQIRGQAQAAEVIGAALLYPHQAPDSELSGIETCLAQKVTG